MPQQKKASDETLMEYIERFGVEEAARMLGMGRRTVQRRRRKIEQDVGRLILSKGETTGYNSPPRITIKVMDGYVIIGGDAHYWPGDDTPGHRAFVYMNKHLKPKAAILNGDVIDAATISRHPPIAWEQAPDVYEELEWARKKTDEIIEANPDADYLWTLGNHDARFETRLAMAAPEYRKVKGVHLKDHFPDWKPCWSVDINGNVIVKHRFKGGIGASHNNTMWGGRTMITNHTHRLQVTPFEDYNGLRWGCEAGTLANKHGPQFVGYTEDSPLNWTQGFLVLQFVKGHLMWPEIVHVIDNERVYFRGEVIEV